MDVKQKKKPTKIEEMTKEQIRQAIVKKRECNAKAQAIVESLIEKEISETYFLQCLPEINQCHFDDIIEERCIVHLCGYPPCQKQLLEKEIPKQKYRISIKKNKVYDITVRKNFCSNSCYKSAMHIKKQMLTSPLWFREYEEIPQFHLLTLDTIGSLGQEVDLSMIERVEVKPEKQVFTPINYFTRASLKDIENYYNNEKHGITSNTMPNVEDQKSNINNICENQKMLNTNDTIDSKLGICNVKLKLNKQTPNPLNIVGEIVEKLEKQIDPILVNAPQIDSVKTNTISVKKPLQRKQPSVIAVTIEVEKCLAEWFTIDTLIFIFGENKVKEMVADKGECIKEYLNNYAKSIFYNSNSYDQYQALCRKLNMLELEDRKNDVQTLQREMKPLPDYSILQEESKNMQLKVKAFLSGDTEIQKAEVSDIPKPESKDDDNPTQLPLVDKNAQNALRRRIVWEHLNKVLPDILRSLNLSTLSISSDVRLLINTFKLKANNIMFKPIQWTLIAIVFIKLLSFRDQRLHNLLEQQTAFQHLQLLLLSYKQDGGYLDRLLAWLTDIDRLLDVNDTQLTIE